ncbi:Muniscin C-terminal mu homology domain-containing protein [Lipomyces arxii]|uniref:Muniscin C-terminal mu homology domain-containing protein n=1 Tax=Lipomyces arxii TaxID=56418 RepID=UPI0034CEAD97
MQAIQDNLTNVARAIEAAEDKVEKYKRKGSSKLTGAHEDANNAVAEWDSQAPLVFEKLQGLDESRLVMLKDVLTRYQTSEVDKLQRVVSLCEANLNLLLSYDPQDEIKMFAMQIQTNGAPRVRAVARHVTPPLPTSSHGMAASSPVAARGLMGSSAVSAPSFNRRVSVATTESAGSTPTPTKLKFSRMSTILRSKDGGRRGLFGYKDKDKHKYREQLDVSPVRDTRRQSVETSSIASSQSRASSRPEPPTTRTMSGAVPIVQSTPAPVTAPLVPVVVHGVAARAASNGHSRADDPDAINVIGAVDTTYRAPASVPPPVVTRVDSDGYSIPGPVSKDSMIASFEEDMDEFKDQQPNIKVDIQQQHIKDEKEDAQAAVEHVAASLRSKPSVSGRSGRGRRGESRLYSTPPLDGLYLQNAAGSHGTPPPPPPHRGEHPSMVEDVPSDIVKEKVNEETDLPVPIEETSEQPVIEKAAYVPELAEKLEVESGAAVLPPLVTTEIAIADSPVDSAAEQFHSTVSTPYVEPSSVINIAEKVEDDSAQYEFIQGLSGSVMETVSATIRAGAATNVTVVGEVTMSLASEISAGRPVRLRIGDESKFEQVLPNASVLNETDTEGEYMLATETLSPIPSIALRYTITDNRFAPIVLEPTWKFEEKQTSLLLYFSMNPEYIANEITLSDFKIEVAIEGTNAIACRSKPSGLFEQEEGKLVMSITAEGQEITLRKSDAKVQNLVRFWTESMAHEASGGGVVASFRYWPAKEVSACDLEVLDSSKSKRKAVDPFADDSDGEESTGEWISVPVVRSVVSGRYLGKVT